MGTRSPSAYFYQVDGCHGFFRRMRFQGKARQASKHHYWQRKPSPQSTAHVFLARLAFSSPVGTTVASRTSRFQIRVQVACWGLISEKGNALTSMGRQASSEQQRMPGCFLIFSYILGRASSQ